MPQLSAPVNAPLFAGIRPYTPKTVVLPGEVTFEDPHNKGDFWVADTEPVERQFGRTFSDAALLGIYQTHLDNPRRTSFEDLWLSSSHVGGVTFPPWWNHYKELLAILQGNDRNHPDAALEKVLTAVKDFRGEESSKVKELQDQTKTPEEKLAAVEAKVLTEIQSTAKALRWYAIQEVFSSNKQEDNFRRHDCWVLENHFDTEA